MEVTSATETTAVALFLKGIKYEREANHFKAIRCYKQALKLDPDVEKKIEHIDLPLYPTDSFYECNANYENENDQKVDLFLKFQRLLDSQLCSADCTQRNTHISSLPPELILYIFRWVVSCDLDLRSLEQCAAVCRGWYLCARDPDLWRRACSKFWPSNVNDLGPYDGNWRRMFVERPNVLTIGCYISKISYVRRGEESFRDNTNGPSFNVDYYRYLRFFSNGRVLMMVTNESPKQIVRTLQTREKAPTNVCPGYYQLSGDKLFLTLDSEEKEHERMIKKYGCENNNQKKITYKMILGISKYKTKYNWKLHWIDYELIYYSVINKKMVTKYDLPKNRFPPFIFSRVKCYSNESKWVL